MFYKMKNFRYLIDMWIQDIYLDNSLYNNFFISIHSINPSKKYLLQYMKFLNLLIFHKPNKRKDNRYQFKI